MDREEARPAEQLTAFLSITWNITNPSPLQPRLLLRIDNVSDPEPLVEIGVSCNPDSPSGMPYPARIDGITLS